jgi:outer membrane receptor protein involved in Fe transport
MNASAVPARLRAGHSFAYLFCGITLLGASHPSTAETPPTGALSGVVNAADGDPLPDARVRVIDASGHIAARITTDKDGRFSVADLVSGHYTVSATSEGVDLGSVQTDVRTGETQQVHLAATEHLETVVVTSRFEQARNALSPSTGSSQYVFGQKDIENLPQGEHTPLNEVLLQAPGVANDAYGQVHVRGDHADLQYRIDGVILPEGVSSFGQTFDTRFADKIDLLTGALPAQYGYRTAGVVDITTKKDLSGGNIDLYGGSHSTINPSVQYGYTQGHFSSYFTGSYLSSTLGLEPPTSAANAIHDRTTQGRGFGYLSYVFGNDLKLSGIFGAANNRFEIPNSPDQPVDCDFVNAVNGNTGCDASNPPTVATVNGSTIRSATVNERQFERNYYGIGALQGINDDLNWQLALFDRQSAVEYQPDPLGDLVFNGDASKIKRKSTTFGLQGDASYPIADDHTLRAGFFASDENDRADDTSTVFTTSVPTSSGAPPQLTCPPGSSISGDQSTCYGGAVSIVDNNPKNGNTLYGVYVQDQWDLSKAVTLNYGVRFDKLHAFTSASQLSPRLGMIWHASDATTVHAGYARYFTPPVNELISNTSITKFNDTTNAFEVTRNSPVQPERQHYFDVGVVQQILPSLSVGLDTYYKYIRELQDEGQFGQALIFAPFNYQQGHVYGVELTSAFHEGDFSAYLNIARSRAQATRVTSGEFNFGADDLSYIEDHYIFLDHDQSLTISSGASYKLHGTTLGITGTYGDGLRADAVDAAGNTLIPNGAKVPPNMQIDLSAARTVHVSDGFGDLDLRMAAINVLDRTNVIHNGTGVGVGVAQYGPRAALYFGVSKPF